MSKFCKECGKPLDNSLKFCQHCGQQVDAPTEARAATPKRQPKTYTKKQKIIAGVVAGLFILMIGLYNLGISYYSAEKTAERFISAIVDEDYEKVQRLAMMNDTEISEAEAKALIALAHEESNYISLNPEEFIYYSGPITLIEDGKAFLFFDKHAISLTPQYAAMELPFEGIEITFNEEAFEINEENENFQVFGPMAPGKYDLHSSYSGEYTTAESDDMIILADTYGDYVYHPVDLQADFVQFSIHNQIGFPINKAYITVNDQEVPFEENVVINQFGPLNLDGSITVIPTIETDWGKMTLNKITIVDNYYEIMVDALSDELITELSDAILLYGEDYVKAYAANDIDLFTNITADLRETFIDNFKEHADRDIRFAGQLDKIEVDFGRARFSDEYELHIPASFHFTASTFNADNEADLQERIDTVDVKMAFDADEKKWRINSSRSRGWFSGPMDVTHTLEGSQELANASATVSAPASNETDEAVETRVNETTLDYVHHIVAAINAGDYELVRPYIKDDSPLHDMQADLVNRLANDGMKQEVIEASVVNAVQDGNTWKVTTNETIKLLPESGDEETKEYEWIYTVEVNDDQVELTNIE